MWRKIRSAIIAVGLTIVFAAGLKSCIIDAYRIPTASMSETLLPGDFLLVNKFIYGAKTPSPIFFIPVPSIQFPKIKEVLRGNVIVFEFPGEPGEVIPVRHQYLVKRCVGLPADTIEIHHGTLTVNSRLYPGLEKKFVQDFSGIIVPFKGMEIHLDSSSLDRWKILICREGHTVERYDSKIFVDRKQASSYRVQKNYYFALGDNVNNSYDSRFWGCIPADNIVGEALVVYWSKGDEGIRWNRIGTIVR